MSIPTVVDQHTDLISQLAEVLQKHPLGEAFTLLYTPDQLPLAQDEILVQRVDPERRVVELRPTALSDIALGDVLHTTQTVNPQDDALTGYAQARIGSDCHKINGGHYYSM
ncbi:hypothetical protein ACFWCA_19425 [Streptomyces phaeochromogenes]|uniref:hypothetical protein n=1 Tax=Streptomyces phaeochromogenes TaxID=1923 RepID=UPI003680388F